MRFATLAAFAVLVFSSAALAAGTLHRPRTPEMTQRRTAEPTEGTWTMEAGDDGTMQVSLRAGTSSWGRPMNRADLVGLTDAQVRASVSTPVAFRIEREPGSFDLEGAFREGRGAGHFRFHPNAGFASTLRGMGVRDADRIEDKDLMVMALAGSSAASLRDLAGLGVRPATVDEVVEVALFDVTPAYVREVRGLWREGTESVEDLVEMRIHRVSAAFVRELEGMGFSGLSRDDVMQMGIHGVSGDQVRAFRELGITNLTAQQAVDLKIHGVTPEYVREMRAAGFGDLSADALAEMRIHRVTPAYIQSLADAGYRGLDREQLMDMGVHGVTPEFIREVRAAGFNDLSPEALVQMRIHGIGAEYGRGARRRGRGE